MGIWNQYKGVRCADHGARNGLYDNCILCSEQKREMKKQERQMQIDYPHIIISSIFT